MVPKVTYLLIALLISLLVSFVWLGSDHGVTILLALAAAATHVVFFQRIFEERRKIQRRRDAEAFADDIKAIWDMRDRATRKNYMVSNEKKDDTSH